MFLTGTGEDFGTAATNMLRKSKKIEPSRLNGTDIFGFGEHLQEQS